jgi:hypothetical protein
MAVTYRDQANAKVAYDYIVLAGIQDHKRLETASGHRPLLLAASSCFALRFSANRDKDTCVGDNTIVGEAFDEQAHLMDDIAVLDVLDGKHCERCYDAWIIQGDR